MSIWRMSFRCGSRGEEMWRQCRLLGVAAITYSPLEGTDLSRNSVGKPKRLWSQLKPAQKGNLRKFAYEMRQGDTIYAKEGPQIVCRGTVTGPYFLDNAHRIVDHNGFPWTHQVPVAWDRGFTPVRVLLGSEQTTVLRLSGTKLERLRAALCGDPGFVAKATKADLAASQAEAEPLAEGGPGKSRRTSVYERNPKLRLAAILHHGTKCAACDFDFACSYGEHGLGFVEVHHLRPVSTLKRRSLVDPRKDMAVLCSNCHRMVHRRPDAVLSVAELRHLIEDARGSR